MTVLQAQAGREGAPISREIDGLMLSWEALADAPGARQFTKEDTSEVRLVMEVEGKAIGVFVEVVGASEHITRTCVGSPAPVTVVIGAGDIVHIDAPSVLRATLVRTPDGSLRPVYARTPLLASLGFPGGSYDRPVVAWARQIPDSKLQIPDSSLESGI